MNEQERVQSVLVNCGGDILLLSLSEVATENQHNWLNQFRFTGANPALEARARMGWAQYHAAVHGPTPPQKIIPILKRSWFRFWLRCKLTKWGII